MDAPELLEEEKGVAVGSDATDARRVELDETPEAAAEEEVIQRPCSSQITNLG